jgi:hypothetical protein
MKLMMRKPGMKFSATKPKAVAFKEKVFEGLGAV